MKWTDINDIAIELSEAHPGVDPTRINFVDLMNCPTRINFVDLMNWVLALPGFSDDPKHCGEKILEAIQQAWIDEAD
ncbi:MAG: Fe-S cluster assembly protein IscX [Proteobacteria bacterium]|nr:Fe-S cluster assembly protein IscX [Pseudomonadota bacterium]